VAGIVSLKASIEAWDQVDALLRQSIETYARTLGHIEQHLSRKATEKFGVEGLDFRSQQAALADRKGASISGLSALESVSREVELELRAFGERLCQNACSSQDLRDVAAVLEQAISGILETGSKHQEVMRSAAGRLRTASESDNVTALRILVRYQSAELVRLADEAGRESQNLAAALRIQVGELTAGLKIAHEEAREDPLTGMLNRRALKEIMDEFQAKETPRCLILLDLDRFKSINDKFGYLAGDELLRQVAARIRSSLLPSCAAARWGGDEFIVLVDGSLSTGMSLAQTLDQRLRNRYKLGDGKLSSVFAQASVGLSDWKRGDDVESVIQRADLALKSKKRGLGAAALEPVR
jgi:diguanylate cyclase (GGDEF)-like protein